MSVLNLFDYERLFPLVVEHPITKKPIGLTLNIRSAFSEAVKRVDRKFLDSTIERSQSGKKIDGDMVFNRELETAASYVASWEVDKKVFKGEMPEYSIEAVSDLLEQEPWIFDEVVRTAKDIENFMNE